jgi:hypothetical protein
MAKHPQHTAFVPDDDFEVASRLSSNNGGGLNDDDFYLDLNLDISSRSSDLCEFQLIHILLLVDSPAMNSNDMDCMVLDDPNRSSFDMETMLMDLSQRQHGQLAEDDMDRVCLLETIKEFYNPCLSNHHRSSLPDPIHSQQHRVRSVSHDLESNFDLALTRFSSQSGMISHQSIPWESTPVAVDSIMAPSCRFRRRNAICHRF